AVVSATGIYLGFPQQARSLMSSVAAMNPQGPRPNAGTIARDAHLTPEAAFDLAAKEQTGARPVVIFLPTVSASGGERGRARGEATNAGQGASPIWRVQFRSLDSHQLSTITVDDRTGAVARAPAPLAGDRAAQWIRWIHEGSRGGPIWQLLVFLT